MFSSRCTGLAIYDTMIYIASPVSTICVGQAASMGSLLLCGGSAGQRFCLPHSSIMIHQPSGGYAGQASDIAIHAKEILRVRDQLNRIYERHLKIAGKERKVGEVEKLMDRDYFMNAREALEFGLVDRILERREGVDGSGSGEGGEGGGEGRLGGGSDRGGEGRGEGPGEGSVDGINPST